MFSRELLRARRPEASAPARHSTQTPRAAGRSGRLLGTACKIMGLRHRPFPARACQTPPGACALSTNPFFQCTSVRAPLADRLSLQRTCVGGGGKVVILLGFSICVGAMSCWRGGLPRMPDPMRMECDASPEPIFLNMASRYVLAETVTLALSGPSAPFVNDIAFSPRNKCRGACPGRAAAFPRHRH
jgi:hypothetical protein